MTTSKRQQVHVASIFSHGCHLALHQGLVPDIHKDHVRERGSECVSESMRE